MYLLAESLLFKVKKRMSFALHHNLVQEIAYTLREIILEGKYADKSIEKTFKAHRKWGSRDRKFFAEAVYEIIRHKRYFSYLVDEKLSDGSQIAEPWDLIAVYLYHSKQDIPKWEEFSQINLRQFKERNQNLLSGQKEAILHSFPDWLDQLGKAEFKDQWPRLMKALNQPAEVFLRTNTLKTTPEQLQQALKKEEVLTDRLSSDRALSTHIFFDRTPSVQASADHPKISSKEHSLGQLSLSNCLKLQIRKNVFITEPFKKGFFEVQDAASQLIAPLLDPQPGERVVDACAGAGGKSLHLAMLMKNKGKIISMDIHEWKLKELKTRAARNGVDIIETKVIESSKTIKRLEESFDRVLLDVPCSGLGVLRRNPDTKWKLSAQEIDRLVDLQREIISKYSKMCVKGGIMVYATCSILHRENEDQVKWFLSSEAGQGWELDKELRIWPHIDGFDGFYAARMKRVGK